MYRSTIALFLFLYFSALPAQDCDCPSNFAWVQKTFSENDAGFDYTLAQKGTDAYQSHNEIFRAKALEIGESEKCTELLHEWLLFFRPSHLGIRRLESPTNQRSGAGPMAPSDDEIREKFADWEKVKINEAELREALAGKNNPGYAGIWKSGNYKIAVTQRGDGYVGSIIEGDGVYWTKDQVKFTIDGNGEVTYYMRDHSPRKFKAELAGNSQLYFDWIALKRTYPVLPERENIARYQRLTADSAPKLERIDERTIVLRIPSFSYNYTAEIDSLITANSAEILSSPQLIIDVRGNGGGSDGSWDPISPIIYTNPVRTIGVAYLSTELNNSRMIEFINDPKYGFNDEDKEWAQKGYDKLSTRLGEFVSLNDSITTVTTYPEVYPYPERVAILVDENNGSSTEQFLLAARQSSKVKLYGHTTMGVLDISNMHFVTSPCGDFELAYSLSKSYRIPHLAIDEKGIQPDIFVDQSVKNWEWIDFVLANWK